MKKSKCSVPMGSLYHLPICDFLWQSFIRLRLYPSYLCGQLKRKVEVSDILWATYFEPKLIPDWILMSLLVQFQSIMTIFLSVLATSKGIRPGQIAYTVELNISLFENLKFMLTTFYSKVKLINSVAIWLRNRLLMQYMCLKFRIGWGTFLFCQKRETSMDRTHLKRKTFQKYCSGQQCEAN